MARTCEEVRVKAIPAGVVALDVVAPAGAIPHGKYRIVTARAVKGTFTTLLYNGKSPASYTVNYLPDGIEVVIP